MTNACRKLLAQAQSRWLAEKEVLTRRIVELVEAKP